MHLTVAPSAIKVDVSKIPSIIYYSVIVGGLTLKVASITGSVNHGSEIVYLTYSIPQCDIIALNAVVSEPYEAHADVNGLDIISWTTALKDISTNSSGQKKTTVITTESPEVTPTHTVDITPYIVDIILVGEEGSANYEITLVPHFAILAPVMSTVIYDGDSYTVDSVAISLKPIAHTVTIRVTGV